MRIPLLTLLALATAASARPAKCRPRIAAVSNSTTPPPLAPVSAVTVPLASATDVPAAPSDVPASTASAVVSNPDPAPSDSTPVPDSTPDAAPTPAPSPSPSPSPAYPNPHLPLRQGNLLSDFPLDTDLDGSSAVSQGIIAYHNQFRAEFAAPPITWSPALAAIQADHLSRCEYAHFGSDNLATAWSSDASKRWDVGEMLDLWAGEWSAHSGSVDGPLDHFTMMVWKDVTEVGCAWTYDCADPGWAARVYFTCKYSPPGNIVGEEATEVGAYIGA